MTRMWTNAINVPEALRLLRQGLTYKEIGIRLAKEEGRRMPYRPDSVENAIRKFRRAA